MFVPTIKHARVETRMREGEPISGKENEVYTREEEDALREKIIFSVSFPWSTWLAEMGLYGISLACSWREIFARFCWPRYS